MANIGSKMMAGMRMCGMRMMMCAQKSGSPDFTAT